ncbi:uncharacterized [Tachysurus ichikawai]
MNTRYLVEALAEFTPRWYGEYSCFIHQTKEGISKGRWEIEPENLKKLRFASHVATRRIIRCLGDTVTAGCISNIINYRPNKRPDFLATTVWRILACQENRSGKLAMLSSS